LVRGRTLYIRVSKEILCAASETTRQALPKIPKWGFLLVCRIIGYNLQDVRLGV